MAGMLIAAFLSPVEAASAPTYAATSPVRHPVIAFSTGFILVHPDVDNPSQVVTVRPDGTGEHQLTHVPAGKQAGAPDISPDGTTIAYVSNEGADNFSVWTMNIDGSGQHKLFGRGGFDFLQPRWSPDGTKLVVTRCDSSVGLLTNCDIVLTKRDGTRLRTLVSGGRFSGDATFSPDGKWIAFDSDRAGFVSTVWVLHLDGGQPIRLTKPDLEAFWPNWSPDGGHLVMSSNCCRPLSQVFTMRRDGSHLRQLTHATGGGGPAFASYSPDGQHIVFTSDQLRGPAFDRSDLFVMRTDGTHVRRIVDDQPNAVGGDWSRGER
jgi:Tol biopolymer transport system component